MKKIMQIVLVVALVGVASAALAWECHNCRPYHNDGEYSYYSTSRYCAACRPVDIRVRIAEAEKLKARFHYYASSRNPADIATANALADELGYVFAEIDARFGGIR